MAWSLSDLAAIESAIASGTKRVRFADSREVEYRDISDLLKARDAIRQVLDGASGRTMATFAKFDRE